MQGLLSFGDILKATEFDDFLVTKPIADVMSRNVVTLEPSDGVERALAMMDERHISCVVVVDEHGKAVGIFSARDAARLLASDDDVSSLIMRDVMSTPLITMHEDESLLKASQLMHQHRFRRIVIVDDADKPIGILTQFDVIRGLEGKRIQELKKSYAEAEAALSETRKLLAEKAEMERIVDISPAVLYRLEWREGEALPEAYQDAPWAGNAGGCFVPTFVSAGVRKVLGFEPADCLRKDWWIEHVHPDDRPSVLENMGRLFRDGYLRHSYRLISAAGEPLFVEDQLRLSRDEDGRPVEAFGSWMDITERKQAEEALRASEASFRGAMEASFDGMVVHRDGRILFANAAAVRLIGAGDEAELLGKPVLDFLHPDYREVALSRLQRLAREGMPQPPVVERFLRLDGRYIDIEATSTLFEFRGEPAVLTVGRDVTERKQAEIFEADQRKILEMIADSEVGLSEVLEEIVRTAQRQRPGMLGSVLLMDADGRHLRHGAAPGLPQAFSEAVDGIEIGPDATPCGRAAVSGERVIARDLVHDPLWADYKELAASLGLAACWSEPIVLHGKVLGTFAMYYREPKAPDAVDIKIIERLAALAGTAISHKQAEQALRQSEARYRSLFEESRDMMHMVGTDGRIMDVNRAELETLGYTREEMIGKPLEELVCPKYRDITMSKFAALLAGQAIPLYETAMHAKDGSCVDVEVSATPQFDENGKVIASRAIIRDIRERKQKEALLARRERQLAVLAEAGIRLNEELDELEIGRRLAQLACRLVDCEAGGVGLFHDGKICFREYLKQGERVAIELDFPAGYGVPGHVLKTRAPYVCADAPNDPHVIPEIQQALGFVKLIDVPILDAAGELLGCFEMHDRNDGADFDAQDLEMLQSLAAIAAAALVNARQQREISQAAERMRAVLDAEFDAVVVHQDFQVLFSNKQACKLFGYDSPKQALGEDLLQVFAPEQHELVRGIARQVLRSGKPTEPIEMLGVRKNGKVFPMEVACSPIQWQGKATSMFVVRDISERKRAEEALTSLNRTLAMISDCNQALVRATDEQALLQTICRLIVDQGGYRMAWVGEARDDPEQSVAPLAWAGAEDGYLKSVRISWGDGPFGQGPVGRAIRERRPVACQDIVHHPMFAPWKEEAARRGYAACAALPLIVDGQPAGALAIYASEPYAFHARELALLEELAGDLAFGMEVLRHKKEKEALQRQFQQAQKMETIGTLAGGIAHDFNNMLAGMVGQMFLLKQELRDRPKSLERIEKMERQGMRAAELIQQMLTFARRRQTEMRPMPLAALLKETMKLHAVALPESISLRTSFEHPEIIINGDAAMVQQVVLNLLSNARDAVAGAKDPRITMTLEPVSPQDAVYQRHAELQGKPLVCLKVADNGCGMPESVRRRIFEPFFTTKDVGKGTGLGLAMVYGAMQTHGGVVEVQSEEGRGTEFRLYFPRIDEAVCKPEAASVEVVPGDGVGVLVADDEENVREAIGEALADIGYRVFTAADGEQAVALYRKHRDGIAIAVLDVVMPKMSGVDACQRMREIDPELPVLFHTGYGQEVLVEQVLRQPLIDVIGKPASIAELTRKMARLLH